MNPTSDGPSALDHMLGDDALIRFDASIGIGSANLDASSQVGALVPDQGSKHDPHPLFRSEDPEQLDLASAMEPAGGANAHSAMVAGVGTGAPSDLLTILTPSALNGATSLGGPSQLVVSTEGNGGDAFAAGRAFAPDLFNGSLVAFAGGANGPPSVPAGGMNPPTGVASPAGGEAHFLGEAIPPPPSPPSTLGAQPNPGSGFGGLVPGSVGNPGPSLPDPGFSGPITNAPVNNPWYVASSQGDFLL